MHVENEPPRSTYLDLLKLVLTDLIRQDAHYQVPVSEIRGQAGRFVRLLNHLFNLFGYSISKEVVSNYQTRLEGRERPLYGETMIGLNRLNNLQFCLEEIARNQVVGDVIEAGVWRGGASIFMKAVLEELQMKDRVVWLADSFDGLPKPSTVKYPLDEGLNLYKREKLKVNESTVIANFKKYHLWDDQVKILKGWFKDTLHTNMIGNLALIRLDGDLYESTMDGLTALYPKLSLGGYIVIDDWGSIQACRQATLDYRNKYQITEEIIPIDWTGVYWRKEKNPH